jgi:hypothetical protein
MDLTLPQLHAVYRLAREWEHAWPAAVRCAEGVQTSVDWDAPPEKDQEQAEAVRRMAAWLPDEKWTEFERIVSAMHLFGPSGPWSHPEPNCRGLVCHRTATGRTGWEIDRDGSVDLRIYRPGDIVVLRARVQHGGTVEITRTGNTPVGRRHLDSLAQSIAALLEDPDERGEEAYEDVLFSLARCRERRARGDEG